MTLIEFGPIDLVGGLWADVEGRVEVTVTDGNVSLGAVELIVPGSGRTIPGTRGDPSYLAYDYQPLDGGGYVMETVAYLIRRALREDRDWMTGAHRQARRAA